ncbi:MAG: SDR family oxidoreductase [Beijerinckiaceae bacterium]
MSSLAGEIAVVTGAAGGLGATVSRRLAADGARLVLLDLDAGRLEKLAQSLSGAGHVFLAGDITNREEAQKTIAAAVKSTGAPTILVALAGGFDMGPAVHETSDDLWAKMLKLNVGTLLPLLAAITPGMIENGRGSIVAVGAMGGLKGGANMGAYAASKSALMRLVESSAAELKDKGVRVNAVLPSIIDTPANRKDMPEADFAQWVSPGELAAVISFLASKEASGVTGALVPVTGRV